MVKCPCCSQLDYSSCCKPFHEGTLRAPTALALMRSRYSAYALGIAAYIQQTTHPQSPHFDPNTAKWNEEILLFCRSTTFVRLEIFSFGENWVHFCAHLEQNQRPFTLNEKSRFEHSDGQWKYLDGEFFPT